MEKIRKVEIGTLDLDAKTKKYLSQVMESGRLSYGSKQAIFEERWSEAHGFRFSVFVNSGTSALHIALQAMKLQHGWEDGDEVIVPATTFVATINIVLHNRLKPVLCDVDPWTFNMDPEEVERVATHRTRAIIPVHVMGLPCDMENLCEIAETRGWEVLEDSCECALTPVEPRGRVACFSTYMAHTITTGVGGFASTDDPDLAIRMRSLANHGRDSIYLSIDDDDKNPVEAMAKRFRFVDIGHSFRATEFEAAMGLGQMDMAKKIQRGREESWSRIDKALRDRGVDEIVPQKVPSLIRWAPLGFAARAPIGERDSLLAHLELNGIETRELLPILGQPCYDGLLPQEGLSISWSLRKTAFYLPCHQDLSRGDIDYMADTIMSHFRGKEIDTD